MANLLANFTVLTWNMGGAKYFSELRETPNADTWNDHVARTVDVLVALLEQHNPDVVALQEVPKAEDDGARFDDVLDQLEERETGYEHVFFVNLQSDKNKIRSDFRVLAETFPMVLFKQGYAFLYRCKNSFTNPRPLWEEQQLSSGRRAEDSFDAIHLSTGLYVGDRNTEPRLAALGRFFKTFESSSKDNATSLEVCILNVHLSTLRHERENMPGFDMESSALRRSQIDTLLKYVITPYNKAIRDKWEEGWNKIEPVGQDRKDGLKQRTPLWFIAGDLNCSPESSEMQFLEQMHFVDLLKPPVGKERQGTKMDSSHDPPTLVLDYILAGPSFTLERRGAAKFTSDLNSQVIDIQKLLPALNYATFPSDHIPVFADLQLSQGTVERALDTVGTREKILEALRRMPLENNRP